MTSRPITSISGAVTPISAKNSYGYFLPSLDLNLLVLPNLKVRLDYSRTESPPNNAQLIPGINLRRTGERTHGARATTPDLLPYLSQNFDLGAEWYYASNDYVSVDGFFKHVTQFPVSTVTAITVPGVSTQRRREHGQSGGVPGEHHHQRRVRQRDRRRG